MKIMGQERSYHRESCSPDTIDNIREGKLKEIRREKHNQSIEMENRKQLFPELVCTQIARVEFK